MTNVWGSGDSTIAVDCATVAFISDDGNFTVSGGCTAIGSNFLFLLFIKKDNLWSIVPFVLSKRWYVFDGARYGKGDITFFG